MVRKVWLKAEPETPRQSCSWCKYIGPTEATGLQDPLGLPAMCEWSPVGRKKPRPEAPTTPVSTGDGDLRPRVPGHSSRQLLAHNGRHRRCGSPALRALGLRPESVGFGGGLLVFGRVDSPGVSGRCGCERPRQTEGGCQGEVGMMDKSLAWLITGATPRPCPATYYEKQLLPWERNSSAHTLKARSTMVSWFACQIGRAILMSQAKAKS